MTYFNVEKLFSLHLLLFITLFFSNALLATDLVDYKACFKSNSSAIYNDKQNYCIGIEKHKKVCHTPYSTNAYPLKGGETLLKFDPYLRLSLIKTDYLLEFVNFKSLFYYHEGDEIALIDKNRYEIIKFKAYSNGLEIQSQLFNIDALGKVLGVKCYKAVGFGSVNNTFISSDLLLKFAQTRTVHYGDIGVRLNYNKKKKIVVEYRDLFFADNAFLLGDELLVINNIKVKNLNQASRTILDLPYDKEVNIKIRRNGKIKIVKTNVQKRYGGGYLADLFIERFGLFFTNEFTLTDVDDETIIGKKRLKAGDKLLQVDRMAVTDHKSLKKYISNKKERRTSLLFERDGFQFFLIIE